MRIGGICQVRHTPSLRNCASSALVSRARHLHVTKLLTIDVDIVDADARRRMESGRVDRNQDSEGGRGRVGGRKQGLSATRVTQAIGALSGANSLTLKSAAV